jgi:hypothetical protein
MENILQPRRPQNRAPKPANNISLMPQRNPPSEAAPDSRPLLHTYELTCDTCAIPIDVWVWRDGNRRFRR